MTTATASVVTVQDRLDGATERYGVVLEQVFWTFVLVSWIPVIYALSLFPSSDASGSTGPLPIVVPSLNYYGHPYLNVMSIGTALSAAIALLLRKPYYLASLIFPIMCNFIPVFNDDVALSPQEAVIYTAFLVCFLVSVFTFMRFGHFLSPSFGMFSFVLVVDALIINLVNWFFESANIPSVFELAFSKVAPNILAALLFVVSAVLLRVVYLAIDHNREFFASLHRAGDLRAAMRKAAILWSPMFAIFLAATAFYAVIFYYSGRAYVSNVVGYVQTNGLVDPSSAPPPDSLPIPQTTEEATTYLERAHTLTIKEGVDATARNLEVTANENVQAASDQAVEGMRAKLPERAPGTNTHGCGWLDLKCHFMNLVKSITNSIYQSFRRDFLNELDRRLDAAAARAGSDIAAFKAAATEEVNDLADTFSKRVEVGLQSSFRGYEIASWIALLYSLIILIKTYLIVFARVIFNAEYSHFASFEAGKMPEAHGEIVIRTSASNNELTWPASDGGLYFVNRSKLGLTNHPASKRRPKPLAAIFTRLANKTWTLNKVDMSKRDRYAGISATPPNSLVEWKLKRNERVIFWFSNFGAMNGDLRIDRIVTFSVAGLAFGRSIYYCAQGPGTLIIRTNNPAIVSGSNKASRSYSTPCFVAWDTRCNFKIDADLTIQDTFRSGVNVRKSRGDHVVVDTAPDEGQKVSTGILMYITNFLLPI